jgi:indole-3-glycerol phosphate synthase
MALLERILDRTRSELEELRATSLPRAPARRPLSLGRAAGGPLALITEIKLKSPSAGELSKALGVTERARAYEAGGASMLSVLCDPSFFSGSYQHLTLAREATELPILCKDFVIDERQVEAARAYGADAILLIVRCLSPERLSALVRVAEQHELVPFVEITNDSEAAWALDAGAELIGVNARDLDTLEMDLARAERVLEALPDRVVRVHLSGVQSPRDIARVRSTGADAALIGEVLMRKDDPTELLTRLVAAAKNSPEG